MERTRKKRTAPSPPKGGRFSRAAEIACIVLAALFGFLAAVAFFLLCADAAADLEARVVPSYAREDLSAVAEKEAWNDADYELIYRQTGLAKPGADRLRARGELFLLSDFQDAFFFRGEVCHIMASPVTPHDYLEDPETGETVRAPIVPLEAGDVIVSSSCHTFGWRNGHAALVVDEDGSTLESVTVGYDSDITFEGTDWFCEASNFMVLRLKGATKEERAAIAADAEEKLLGVPYSLAVGLFMAKDQCAGGAKAKATNCSHLVWQAFKNCGYDIDTDGGPVCTARDIANCPLFEPVQVYGFDPDKPW